MHKSAMKRMEWFIENYAFPNREFNVLDVGSCNVNGCFKPLFSKYNCEYVGMDISAGPNVDVVVKDPYDWKELEDSSFDFIISGNAFEHIEYPWLTMQQVYRKLKICGICCIITPFNLKEHKYPTDCYRYYPDGMKALAKWANLIVIDCTTGGVPEGVDVKQWIPIENYDDTVLVAAKIHPNTNIKLLINDNFPKLVNEVRSSMIY